MESIKLLGKQYELEEARFLHFPHLSSNATHDGEPRLNKYSSNLTKGHDFPGAKVQESIRCLHGSRV
jgi:dihydroxy-acid dehydratase